MGGLKPFGAAPAGIGRRGAAGLWGGCRRAAASSWGGGVAHCGWIIECGRLLEADVGIGRE